MRSLRSLALLAFSISLVACSNATPGWTYAPAPSASAVAAASSGASDSAAPSGSAGASAPAGGSGAPSGSPAASSSGSDGGAVLKIAALNIAFDQATLSAPADQPFQIEFANNDAGVPHNVGINDAAGAEVFKGDIFNGVAAKTYDVPALKAGTYTFICNVHPNMTGSLTVS